MNARKHSLVVCLFAVSALPAFAGVTVTSPSNGATSGSPVHFVAKAESPACPKGVSAMGIYTAPGKLAYTVNGTKMDTNLSLSNGTYNIVVQEWDNCGWSAKAPIKLTVGGSSPPPPPPPSGGKTFSNLQKSGGWTGMALLPPSFGICSSCTPTGSQAKWSWTPNVSSPSLSGASTKTAYNGGSTQWGDILWNNHLIGDFSSQGLPDFGKTLAPTLHNFTYDIYFWIGDASVSQALEFDINQFVHGKSFIWGHECRIAGGHEWDSWSNPGQHWVKSGIACNPISNAWNHLTITAQRTDDDHLVFKTITLNGKTGNLNRTDTPTSQPTWYGVTVNYQIDSDRNKTPYPVYIDKFTFTATP
ncbi:MAG TPA: hypothetical protein VJ731_07165 [Terriglobales bacterium]|nr:hypothetical protein [Terriglobales bacterium]